MSPGSHGALTLPYRPGAFERLLCAVGLFVSVGLIVYKLFLADRLNINWDEFLFLSQVHALARGEMTQLFQGAYAHLFQWLPAVAGNEIDQINSARFVMVALLAITAALVWVLGRSWLTGFPSFVPPLSYLSALPVMQHGGSFRVDSLLAPLIVLVLVLHNSSKNPTHRDWCAGAVLGVAFAVSIKTILFLPMIVLMLVLRDIRGTAELRAHIRQVSRSIARTFLTSALVAGMLLALHASALAIVPVDSLVSYGTRVAQKTLWDAPLFSRIADLGRYLTWQPLPWLLIALGTLFALVQRRFQAAALCLALLPVVIYRNAFPYFYVVMLAPAVILAGTAAQDIASYLRSRYGGYFPAVLICAIAIGLLYQARAPARFVWDEDQSQQRAVVAALHRIFPEPVNYIDCCGMISSFRKVNFFMSTWGLEDYRARNHSFMKPAMSRFAPAFVVVNTPNLDPHRVIRSGLLEVDRKLIADFYPVYWGPIRVAGAEGRLVGDDPLTLVLPFAGSYRLMSEVPVRIDGELVDNGNLISIPADNHAVRVVSAGDSYADHKVALFISIAQPAPEQAPPNAPLFSSL